jgi:hypothetical protein
MKKKTSILEDPIFQTLVAAISALMAKLANLKTSGSYQEAFVEIDRRLDELVGLKSDQLMGLSDAFIIDLLTVNEFLDVQRLWFLAELINAEGEMKSACGLNAEGRHQQIRALGLFIEVAFGSAVEIPSVSQFIDTLFDDLRDHLSEDVLFSLYDYYDRSEDFGRAIAALNCMLSVTRNNPDILTEKRDFYKRLSELPDEDLISAGLTRSQLEEVIRV